MKIPMDPDTSSNNVVPGDDVAVRMVSLLAEGSERLIELQSEMAALLTSESMRTMAASSTMADAAAAMWQLPTLYGELFEQMTQHAHQSCQIISNMNREIVEWVRESATVQTSITVQAIAGLTDGFAERRTRSVVISFPDRRGMIAAARAARDEAARNCDG
jgi:hypothetical protein